MRIRVRNKNFTIDDAHIWDGYRDPAVEAFLGEDFLRWGRTIAGTPTLMVRRDASDHGADFLVVQPGWLLVRWTDGTLMIHSPESVDRLYELDTIPEAP